MHIYIDIHLHAYMHTYIKIFELVNIEIRIYEYTQDLNT